MNKKILNSLLFALIIFCSIGAIHASDVNITDSQMMEPGSIDSINIADGDDSGSVNSNTLSTNDEDASLKENVKNQTELTYETANIYYKGSYSVVLKDSNTSLAGKEVNFIINGVNYNSTTDENGTARVNLGLNPGKYTAVAYFLGDDVYGPSNNLTTDIQILPTVKADDIIKYYKGSTQYKATFYDSNGNLLANTDVVITVNGKSYTKKTDSKGVASLAVDLMPGTYKVTTTDPVTGYKLTTTLKVLSTISASTTKKVLGDSRKFSAKFYKSNGKALSKTYVKFKINGKTYKVKTDSQGNAYLSLNNLKKGTYKVVCYNSDGLTKTVKVKIYKKSSTKFTTQTYVFHKGESKKIKVTLLNAFGYAPTSGKIVKIKINGKTYTKKTNSKGVVYLKLPSLKKGLYTVNYKFAGSTHYKATSASNQVAVITSKDAKLTVKSTKTFGHGAGTPLKIAVTASGVAIPAKKVKFTVDGKTYERTTDKNGIASLPINLDIGNHVVNYSISSDSKINGKSQSANIVVKQRSSCKLTWKSGTSFGDSSQKIKVKLTDMNGKAISGKTVKITINSKTYSATTNSYGNAKIKAYAPIGKYTVSVKFGGCNDYLSNSTSKTVTVTSSKLKKGVNEKNTISSLSKYLKASSNCQVGNSKIKSLVNKLTNDLTSEFDKAKAIFNYVRDTLSYSFYYDTKYGATGTLSHKTGNCVDHSHLLVAMFRTAGLAARYVHGKCTFSSGSTYGHVWAQVLIGDTWVCADATSSRNSLGKIVNWNTKTFSLDSRYASLPF